jgi:hypothetical protein
MLNRMCLLALLVAATACGGSSNSSPTSVTPTVSSIAITTTAGSIATVGVSQTIQLTATATLSNGSTQNVSTQATWQSSNQAVATVSSTGLVTSITSGTANISATYQSKVGTLTVSVLNLAPPIGTDCSHGSMSATINGVPWIANCVGAPIRTATTLAFAGIQTTPSPSTVVGVTLSGMTIGPVGTFGSEGSVGIDMGNGLSAYWQNDPTSGGVPGILTLTTLTTAVATGTFSFSAPSVADTGATGTKVVTNGVFNITF